MIFQATFFLFIERNVYERLAFLLYTISIIHFALLKQNELEGIKMKEFKIKINNEIISVNEEVYITYYKMARRERYLD